jgi:transcription elongation factor GreA
VPPIVLTREGAERIERELDRLRGEGRAAIAGRLREAREGGAELAENADYLAAKEEQARLERRIAELEARLERAEIVDRAGSGDVVEVGSSVDVREVGGRRTERYEIVGSGEGDPEAGRISVESPLGSALAGHRAGEVATRSGVRRLKIVGLE